MIKLLFSNQPIQAEKALAIIRIIVGGLMIYHGQEVFHRSIMNGYLDWEVFKKFPSASFVVYFGKSVELIAGIMLTLGWGTRVASFILVFEKMYITFFVGGGKFWYEDQHPFLFILLGIIFFFAGPGTWTIHQLNKSR